MANNKQRQFIFCCSTLPTGLLADLEDWLPDIKHVRTDKAMHLPEHLDVQDLQVPADVHDIDFLADTVEEILKT